MGVRDDPSRRKQQKMKRIVENHNRFLKVIVPRNHGMVSQRDILQMNPHRNCRCNVMQFQKEVDV